MSTREQCLKEEITHSFFLQVPICSGVVMLLTGSGMTSKLWQLMLASYIADRYCSVSSVTSVTESVHSMMYDLLVLLLNNVYHIYSTYILVFSILKLPFYYCLAKVT